MAGVDRLIEYWVARSPDACAVRDPLSGQTLTYRELWRQAGGRALELRARGVERGDLVAVAGPRSVDLTVTVLAIVRAGAAYLPLDPLAPPDRVASILADAQARLVIGPGELAARAGNPPAVEIRPDDPIYVAYTSGSTGRPKGVVVPHRAVVRLVSSPKYCTIAPGDRVAHSSNPAFDATTFELWSTLTAGGTVVVLPTVTDLGLDAWIELVHQERITTMFLTTSLFHMIARERPDAFAPLGTLIVGGEQLDKAAAQLVLSATAPGRLLNAYGPTETTTFATFFECTRESLAGCRRPPIGFALQNTPLHVLDDAFAPVDPGEPGELCIGGPGVALGYVRRPELTAERFVPGPAGNTIYRTGDIVRELPSGALELIGRRDRQIKLRGFRIELDEIETAACETDLVDAAVVEKTGDGPNARLVAFILPARPARALNGSLPQELTAALRERLPEYMVPTRWIVVDRLPLGPTGKVDRAALCARLDNSDETPGMVRTGLEAILQDVLGLTRISPDDNFLALGGNSILAVQVASRVRSELLVALEPGDVLLAESVGGLLAQVQGVTA